MAEGGNSESLKEDGTIVSADVILAECRLVAFKTERSQPVSGSIAAPWPSRATGRLLSMAPSIPTCRGLANYSHRLSSDITAKRQAGLCADVGSVSWVAHLSV
jgi:hypothetical protein